MKKFRSFISVILLCAICLGLCACGISEDEAVGTWVGSYTYEGNQFTSSFVLTDDKTYVKVTMKDGALSSTENGTYEIKGNKVILHKDGNMGISITYKYKRGNLVNNDHKFSKVG